MQTMPMVIPMVIKKSLLIIKEGIRGSKAPLSEPQRIRAPIESSSSAATAAAAVGVAEEISIAHNCQHHN